MAKVTIASVHALILEQNSTLMGEIKVLRDEVSSLRTELADIKSQPGSAAPLPTTNTPSPSFADVVKTSVQTVMKEEKVRNDVIVSGLEESATSDDDAEVTTICDTIDFSIKPIGILRLGKKKEKKGKEERPRLLKMTFPSSFDARAFRSKFVESTKPETSPFHSLKCRPGRTKEEQEHHRKRSDAAYKMNKDAKDAGDNASYSVRESGEIWKFVQNDNQKWIRERDWSEPADEQQNSGNGSRTSTPH